MEVWYCNDTEYDIVHGPEVEYPLVRRVNIWEGRCDNFFKI